MLAIFTLETDYPSETGYPLDNLRQTDNTTLKFENGTVLIFDEQSAWLYLSVIIIIIIITIINKICEI